MRSEPLEVSPEFLERSIHHVREIIDRFPPEDFYVLNVGLTTPTLTAVFRQLLPNPDGRNQYIRELPITRIKRVEQLSEVFWPQFFEHFIPSEATLRGRQVVLVRVLWASRSMLAFMPQFEEYVATRRPNLRYGTYFIIRGRQPAIPEELALKQFLRRSSFASDPFLVEDPAYMEEAVAGIDHVWADEALRPAHLSENKPISFLEFANRPFDKWSSNPRTHKLDARLSRFLDNRQRMGKPIDLGEMRAKLTTGLRGKIKGDCQLPFDD